MFILPVSSTLRGRWRRLWESDKLGRWRFYGHYLRWPALLLLLALAADKLIYFGGFPLAAKARCEWNYLLAERAFRGNHLDTALFDIRQALLETRDDPRLWCLAARISDRLDSAEAPYCWQQTDWLRPGSTATELALADSALRYGQPELAHAALAEVLPDGQTGVRYAIDAGELAQAEGNSARAGYWFALAEAARPQDARSLYALADWHGERNTPADQSQARSLLLYLASRPAEKTAACRTLVGLDLRRGAWLAARSDGARLLADSRATFADRVNLLAAAAGPASADAQLAVLLRTPRRQEAALALDWMSAHGRAERALIWIRHQDETWQDDPSIGAARAHCLAALGDWAHLRDDQRDSDWPGHEAERLSFAAQASFALGHVSEARAAWHQAVAACRDSSDFALLKVAAESLHDAGGASDEKAEVWLALANRFPGRQEPLRLLLAYQLGRGDLTSAQKVAENLAAITPGAPTVCANLDLIRLLHHANEAQASLDLHRLVQVAPEDPTVVSAAAYALYRQGRFDEALALLGTLDPSALKVPERAACLGELLAAAGPMEGADAALQQALAQPNLLEQPRADLQRACDLVVFRRALRDLLHAPADARAAARDRLLTQAATGKPVFLIGASVALAAGPGKVDLAQASRLLSRVDPALLNDAEQSLYEGASLLLAGDPKAGAPLLELSPGQGFETPAAKAERAVEAGWSVVGRVPDDEAFTAELLSAYRGLEAHQPQANYWAGDAAREVQLTGAALRHPELAAAVQLRLEALLRHVPPTAELEAQIGYALFRQGRVEAGRERLEVLSLAERAQPDPAHYYAAILQASAAPRKVEPASLPGTRLAAQKFR